MQFEVAGSYKSVARIRLVMTENPTACVTVNCKVWILAVAL
jgi:glucose-6-phosphate dehydrogenase assembly protein OpcA